MISRHVVDAMQQAEKAMKDVECFIGRDEPLIALRQARAGLMQALAAEGIDGESHEHRWLDRGQGLSVCWCGVTDPPHGAKPEPLSAYAKEGK